MSAAKVTLGLVLDGNESMEWASICDLIRRIVKIPFVGGAKVIGSEWTLHFVFDEEDGLGLDLGLDRNDFFGGQFAATGDEAVQRLYDTCDVFVLFTSAGCVNQVAAGDRRKPHHQLLGRTLVAKAELKPVLVLPSGDPHLFDNDTYEESIAQLKLKGCWEFHPEVEVGELPGADELVAAVEATVERIRCSATSPAVAPNVLQSQNEFRVELEKVKLEHAARMKEIEVLQASRGQQTGSLESSGISGSSASSGSPILDDPVISTQKLQALNKLESDLERLVTHMSLWTEKHGPEEKGDKSDD